MESEKTLTGEESQALTRRGFARLALAGLLASGLGISTLRAAVARELEPGDDHGSGGHGADDPPGDDHGSGGHGADDPFGDDHGSGGSGADDGPADDHGRHHGHGRGRGHHRGRHGRGRRS